MKWDVSSFPAAAVQNTFTTWISDGANCALNNSVYIGTVGPTGQPGDRGFSFVGNSVTGGRLGVLSVSFNSEIETSISALLVSGNRFDLAPPYRLPATEFDQSSADVDVFTADRLNVSGNTLAAGCVGVRAQGVSTNALVLANDFGAASLRSLDWIGGGRDAVSVAIANNKLCGGASQHLRGLLLEGTRHFLLGNSYVNTNGTPANLQLEPVALPVHYQP